MDRKNSINNSQVTFLTVQQSRTSTQSKESQISQKIGDSTRNFFNRVKEKLATPTLEEYSNNRDPFTRLRGHHDKYYNNDDSSDFDEIGIFINSESDTLTSQQSKVRSKYHLSNQPVYDSNNASTSSNLTSTRSDTPRSFFNRIIPSVSQSSTDLINELPSKTTHSIFKSTLTQTKPANKSSQIATNDVYLNELKTWELTLKLNRDSNASDPLLYARERLTSFIDTYDLILQKQIQRSNSVQSEASQSTLVTEQEHTLPPGKIMKELKFTDPILSDKIDLLGFWSISALKMLSDAHNYFAKLLTDFANFDLKENDKMRLFNVQGEFFGLQWSWQLGLDNPNLDIYDISIQSSLPINLKHLVGPSNIKSIHGESLKKLNFNNNFFTMAVSYDLWLHLKQDEWGPVIKEMYRVLAPPGFVHFFVCDFDIIGCTNTKYINFFKRVQNVLIKNGMDPFPSKHLTRHLKDAGFVNVKYSCVSLRKGIPNSMGNLVDFIQGYFEFIIFDKISNLEMDANDIQQFRDMKLEYHKSLRNGDLINDFGSGYCTFVFAQKKINA